MNSRRSSSAVIYFIRSFAGNQEKPEKPSLRWQHLNPPSLPIPPRPHSPFILSWHFSLVNHQPYKGSIMQIVQNISPLPLTIWHHPCKIV